MFTNIYIQRIFYQVLITICNQYFRLTRNVYDKYPMFIQYQLNIIGFLIFSVYFTAYQLNGNAYDELTICNQYKLNNIGFPYLF